MMNTVQLGTCMVLALLYATVCVQAQTTLVQGKVVDYKNRNEALPGATVVGMHTLWGTTTQADGTFELSLPDTVTQLAISMMGYASDTVIIPRKQEGWVVFLKKEKLLQEVVFTQRKKGTEISLLEPRKVEQIGQRELMKAACCNLSESFETTPSIDVAYTDAITGYKQIQMLGLAGAHTLIGRENIPDVRGLAAITGLTFTPGAWIESMQLSKGTGSVVNGYEGLAGQLNVEWRKTFTDERWHFNLYQNSQGRTEANIVSSHHLNHAVSTNTFLHGRSQWMRVDQNKDNYLDQPLENQWVAANRWFILLPKNYEIQIGAKGVWSDGEGGQMQASNDIFSKVYGPWKYTTSIRRIEGFTKLGKVFHQKSWKSLGWINSVSYHKTSSRYGLQSYQADQKSWYSNLIYQTIIDNTNHVIKGGASLVYDDVQEQTSPWALQRKEITTGMFTEYTYNHLDKWNAVAGVRADYSNLFGVFMTPRLHIRYSPWKQSSLRASVGRAQRTPNVFAENIGLLASSRLFYIHSDDKNTVLLKPEVAWNYGANFTQKFKLNYREGSFTTDYYYTRFRNQMVVDIESAHAVHIRSLNEPTGVHSFQAQLDYEPIRRLDVRLAYRYYRAKILYQNGWQDKPLMAAHRAFLNVGYETKNRWKMDATFNVIGRKRVPQTFHHGGYESAHYSPSYALINAQISKAFSKVFEVYLGGENLTNYMQHDLVINGHTPYDWGMDASLIWGPAMGRNIYAGLRYTVNKKK